MKFVCLFLICIKIFSFFKATLESSKKPQLYRQLIFLLPKVYLKTLRKLLSHLQEVISHENRNLASLDNISKMFGPTLFTVSTVRKFLKNK